MSVRLIASPLLAPLLLLLTASSSARADQVIVTDVTYTHSAETTSDSHYRVSPSPATPKNWKSPVDYSTGSAHVRLEVKTKPAGNTPTKFQICFEGNPTYACTDQSITYTKTGVYEWTTKVQKFWSPADKTMDWTKGVSKVALILKDDNNNKPQADPKFVPSDLRVEVAIFTADDSYTPPGTPGTNVDAGLPTRDASTPSTPDAPEGDAGLQDDDEDVPVQNEQRDAGASAAVARDAGASPRHDAGRGGDDVIESVEATSGDDDGCALARTGSTPTGLLGLSLLLVVRARRRKHAV